jgi:hypothetical protein
VGERGLTVDSDLNLACTREPSQGEEKKRRENSQRLIGSKDGAREGVGGRRGERVPMAIGVLAKEEEDEERRRAGRWCCGGGERRSLLHLIKPGEC